VKIWVTDNRNNGISLSVSVIILKQADALPNLALPILLGPRLDVAEFLK
jgi:hypothetical protein